jgi:hypothetical protein
MTKPDDTPSPFDVVDKGPKRPLSDGLVDVYVPCRGCRKMIRWTGIYGDWCADCKSRILTT